MPLLGAHMSVAGGLYKAVEAARSLDMESVQIFTHSPSQWSAKPAPAPPLEKAADGPVSWVTKQIEEADARRFREAAASGKLATCVHVSYLINLAAADDLLWRRSTAALVGEVERADQLQIPYVVLHPGAFTDTTEEAGLERIAQGLDEVHSRLPDAQAICLLENTAGQGTCLGWKFEHLARILELVRQNDRLGVCFDTCHAFAAGYGLQTAAEYRQTWKEFDKLIGLERLKVFHLNDSKRERGSRVDRHEHIGEGQLGPEAFTMLLADKRFKHLPMYLETPKGKRNGQELDAINMATLRRLSASKTSVKPARPSDKPAAPKARRRPSGCTEC